MSLNVALIRVKVQLFVQQNIIGTGPRGGHSGGNPWMI